jgi:uncharacterized protein (TIGR03000 family)
MQWTWLLRTKLLLAGLALIVLVGDSMARPGDRRRNRRNQQSQQAMTQPGFYYTSNQVASTTPSVAGTPMVVTVMEGRYVTQRRGLFGRRSTQVWQETPVQRVVYVQSQQQPGTQQAQGQPPAGAEGAPMPSPVASTVQPTQTVLVPRTVTERRGLFGRRTTQRTVYDRVQVASTATQPGTTRQAFYQPLGQVGYIDVRLPAANAEVLFNGAPTVQQGLSRLYVTPALDPQRNNEYEVQARWIDQTGNKQEQTRTIKVPAGGRIQVDFTVQQ